MCCCVAGSELLHGRCLLPFLTSYQPRTASSPEADESRKGTAGWLMDCPHHPIPLNTCVQCLMLSVRISARLRLVPRCAPTTHTPAAGRAPQMAADPSGELVCHCSLLSKCKVRTTKYNGRSCVLLTVQHQDIGKAAHHCMCWR
jgi:hypothetical protein